MRFRIDGQILMRDDMPVQALTKAELTFWRAYIKVMEESDAIQHEMRREAEGLQSEQLSRLATRMKHLSDVIGTLELRARRAGWMK